MDRSQALKHLTTRLPSVFAGCCSQAQIPFQIVDLGAGIYGSHLNGSLLASTDDSDALILLAGFRDRADVFAFEARPDKAEELRQEAQRRSSTAQHAPTHLHVFAMGASESSGQLRFANCGGRTNWMVLTNNTTPEAGCEVKYTIPVRSLDEMAQSGLFQNRSLAYVKVDVEGGEADVAKGMRRMLMEQQVELMSFEYAKNWNADLFHHRQKGNKRLRDLSVLDHDASVKERTLEQFQKLMDAAGYDTYLMHGKSPEDGRLEGKQAGIHGEPTAARVVTAVPVYGRFFSRRDFEICLRRHHFKQPFCWNDLLVIRRGNIELKRRLLQELHGGRDDPFPGCDCI